MKQEFQTDTDALRRQAEVHETAIDAIKAARAENTQIKDQAQTLGPLFYEVKRAIRAGTVTVNSFGEGDISTPFGGFKQSGFGGRDNGIHAHDQYTQVKTIWIDLADDGDEAVD